MSASRWQSSDEGLSLRDELHVLPGSTPQSRLLALPKPLLPAPNGDLPTTQGPQEPLTLEHERSLESLRVGDKPSDK